VLTNYERSKEDNNDDQQFYAEPRFAHHLDQNFRSRLTKLYKEIIPSDSVVLDLMSSWVSHLPNDVRYEKVIGHGLNELELKRNQRLDSFWIQDLNKNQILPLKDDSVDFCLMVAAWQYLQYPEALSVELARVIKPEGRLIVSFSNRAFWSKSPRIWVERSDGDRIAYITEVLLSQGWSSVESIFESQASQGIFTSLFPKGDPFFSVLATNKIRLN